MRRPLTYFFFFLLTLAAAFGSCTKNKVNSNTGTTADTASIIGAWTWASQSGTLTDTTSLTTANTGISRTIIFDTSGQFTFIHNDSVPADSGALPYNLLQISRPVILLPNMETETDTGYYQVSYGIVGCSFIDSTTLTFQNTAYQAHLTTDTLLIFLDPCVSRVADIYLRKQ